MGPLDLARCESDEVRDRLGRVVAEEVHFDVAEGSVEGGYLGVQ
jgi:hypothetical protein